MDNQDAIAVIRVVNAACNRYKDLSKQVIGCLQLVEKYCKDLRKDVENFGVGKKDFEVFMRPMLDELDNILEETADTNVLIDDEDDDNYNDDDVAAGEVC